MELAGDAHGWLATVEAARQKPGAPLEASVNVQRATALPQLLGVNLGGRWRWPLPGVIVTVGGRVPLRGKREHAEDARPWPRQFQPYARARLTRPLLGKAGFLCEAEAAKGDVKLRIRRLFRTPLGAVSFCSTWGKADSRRRRQGTWGLQLDCSFGDAVRACEVRVRPPAHDGDPGVGSVRVVQPLVHHADIIAEGDIFVHDGWRAAMECSSTFAALSSAVSIRGGCVGLASSLPHSVRSERADMKVTPLNKNLLGKKRTVGIVPGHWIDAGKEVGAPGERTFNLEVANRLESKLKKNGWSVLRPDRNAQGLAWDDYLDWVTNNSKRGVPVLEIHGQGEAAAAKSRSVVLGVIGDPKAPLNKRLADTFGFFPMNWMDLAVPRRGGVVVESFNADVVRSLPTDHRRAIANDIAGKVADSIERTVRLVEEPSSEATVEDGCSMSGCDTGIK